MDRSEWFLYRRPVRPRPLSGIPIEVLRENVSRLVLD
jgi:hypothetical protein